MPSHSDLRICYFGTYRANYTRNQILIQGLKLHDGVTLYECHAPLWRGIDDRVNVASGDWRRPSFWSRLARVYWNLLQIYRRIPHYDVMVLGYPGQYDVYIAQWLTYLRRKPLVLDVLMSIHLVAEERSLIKKSPLTGKLIFEIEKRGLNLPDRLIMENAFYQNYISDKYQLHSKHFWLIPHGANDAIYYPRPTNLSSNACHVIYFGSFLPSHGLDTILEAAHLLQKFPDIQFHLYGDGPEKPHLERLAQLQGINNLMFHGFVPLEQLLKAMSQAHICLGVFGTTPQALMTVQNKVWETLAMGRPLISAESPAIQAVLTHREHVFLVPRQNGIKLAEAILEMRANPVQREAMAHRGYDYFKARHSVKALGTQLYHLLRDLTATW